MLALIWALIVTVMDQATPARPKVSMSAQDQNPASARTTSRAAAASLRRRRVVGDVRTGGLEDPQAQQARHGDQGEVIRVGRLAGSGE